MSQQLQTIVQVLAFLGTVALVGIGVLGAVAFALARRPGIAAFAGGGAAALVAGYAAALVALGATSREHVLGPGEVKAFCEIDCHLAYSVIGVHTVPALPTPNGAHATRGAYYFVTVRTHFDPSTISSRRGDGELWPNPRRARIVDARGHVWTPDPAAERALAEVSAAGTPLETPLRPGESYETTLAFDLPADIESPRLELTEATPITRLLLGHENSPLHAKTLLALGHGFEQQGAR